MIWIKSEYICRSKLPKNIFDRANLADEIEVLVRNPEQIEKITEELSNVTTEISFLDVEGCFK